jgi:Arc/MetJ-type ribon-helix-helix transcriptional regulator
MKLITLYLPEPYIKALKILQDEGYFPNRAEAIRTAVRTLLIEYNEYLKHIEVKY